MREQVKEFCEKASITEKQFSGEEKIEGSLDLESLTSIPKGFNPTVGGYLDLRSLTSIPRGFNPTVGRSLDLRSVTSIPRGFNPTVGEYIVLGSNLKEKVKVNNLPPNFTFDLELSLSWQSGRYILRSSKRI